MYYKIKGMKNLYYRVNVIKLEIVILWCNKLMFV